MKEFLCPTPSQRSYVGRNACCKFCICTQANQRGNCHADHSPGSKKSSRKMTLPVKHHDPILYTPAYVQLPRPPHTELGGHFRKESTVVSRLSPVSRYRLTEEPRIVRKLYPPYYSESEADYWIMADLPRPLGLQVPPFLRTVLRQCR